MADISEIRFSFESEEAALCALRAAEILIKLVYAPADLPWVEEARSLTLAQRYFKYGELAAPLDPVKDNPYCCLQRLRLDGTELVIERSSDISRSIAFGYKTNFFSQLCFICALLCPGSRFTARSSYEMTVSAYDELTLVEYDGALMHVRQMGGEEMEREDDWQWSYSEDFFLENGQFTCERLKGKA